MLPRTLTQVMHHKDVTADRHGDVSASLGPLFAGCQKAVLRIQKDMLCVYVHVLCTHKCKRLCSPPAEATAYAVVPHQQAELSATHKCCISHETTSLNKLAA